VPGERTREVTLDPGATTDTPVRNKGQAEACPDRTRAIPCIVTATTGQCRCGCCQTCCSLAAAAVIIGTVSVILSLAGLELGNRIGTKVGERGEGLGGLVLFAVGTAIASGVL
jgi:hypothetical protein